MALSHCEGDSGELERARMGWKYLGTGERLALVLCLKARSNPLRCQRRRQSISLSMPAGEGQI